MTSHALRFPALLTVTGHLQAVALAVRLSPYYVLVSVAPEQAERVVARWLLRYPELNASARDRTVVRRLGYPAPVLLIGQSHGQVTLLLLSNTVPPDERWQRETWRDVRDPSTPLEWHGYVLKEREDGGWTWSIAPTTLMTARHAISEVILDPRRSTTGAQEKLAAHFLVLSRYPGLHGVRVGLFDLQRHAQRQWQMHRQRPAQRHGELVGDLQLPPIPYVRQVARKGKTLGELLTRLTSTSGDTS